MPVGARVGAPTRKKLTGFSLPVGGRVGAPKRKKLTGFSLVLVAAASVFFLNSDHETIDCLQITSSSMAPINLSTVRDAEPVDICFVSCLYAKSNAHADKPVDVRNSRLPGTTTKFFLFTNLPKLKALGWTKIFKTLNYRRFITQSRWGKFMAWKHPQLKGCRVIFYHDGSWRIKTKILPFYYDGSWRRKMLPELLETAKAVQESEVGFAQAIHPDSPRTALEEFDAILLNQKDIQENVDASIKWLRAQPDFFNNCTLYRNTFFGE